MKRKSDIASKIQLTANRIRCPICNGGSSDCVFITSEELRFRRSFARASKQEPVFIKGDPPKLRINRTKNLDSNQVLTRLCIRCGEIRKTSIPNN